MTHDDVLPNDTEVSGSEADLTVGPLIVDADSESLPNPKSPFGETWDFILPSLRHLAEGCVNLIEHAAPGTEVRWIHRWHALLLRTPPPNDRLYGYFMVGKPPLRFGLELHPEDDPHALFEPAPTAKSRARLEITSLEQLQAPELTAVIERAYARARLPKRKATKPRR